MMQKDLIKTTWKAFKLSLDGFDFNPFMVTEINSAILLIDSAFQIRGILEVEEE